MQLQAEFETTQTLKADLGNLPYLRYYMQEELFGWEKGSAQDEPRLPFNQVISDSVSELTLMSKTIANNSRLTFSFLENGREIYVKKQAYFQEFLQHYPLLFESLTILTETGPNGHKYRKILEYSVMALSNLILKLSINMAKISILLTSRMILPLQLNLFTLSILFEKYLELQLFIGKYPGTAESRLAQDAHKIEEMKHYLRTFPKLTLLKVSTTRNPFDSLLLKQTQSLFGPQPNNLQFIQIYLHQGQYSIPPSSFAKHQSYDLKQQFGLSFPLGFQFYLLFSESILQSLVQFKPDAVIFVQDIDCDAHGIDSEVRGLIINQISAKVQNKIYYFRQFGITDNMIVKKATECQIQLQPPIPTINSTSMYPSDRTAVEIFMAVKEQNERQERNQFLRKLIRDNCILMDHIFQEVSRQIDNLHKQQKLAMLSNNRDPPRQKIKEIRNMKTILIQDLNFVSLALIQKSNFDKTNKAIHNHVFPLPFLHLYISWLKQQEKQLQSQTKYGEAANLINSKIAKLEGMRDYSLYVQKTANGSTGDEQSRGFAFYNLQTNKTEYMRKVDRNKKAEVAIVINPSDTFYVHYGFQFTAVFVFNQSHFITYARPKNETIYQQARVIAYSSQPFLAVKGSTLVANQKYLYKAFGEMPREQQNAIFRFQLGRIQNIPLSQWQKVSISCKPIDQNSTEKTKNIPALPLQKKVHGYGFCLNTANSNVVIFGGGYNYQSYNEERVNRFFYLIRDNQKEVYKIGKTNSTLVEEGTYLKQNKIIYPFVYGLPLENHKKRVCIINTNGYMQSVNHFKKIVVSKIEPSSALHQIGISHQNRLQVADPKQPEVTLANKNTILSHLMHSYHQINRLGHRAVLSDSCNQLLVLQLTSQEGKDSVRIEGARQQEQMIEEVEALQICFKEVKMGIGKIQAIPSRNPVAVK